MTLRRYETDHNVPQTDHQTSPLAAQPFTERLRGPGPGLHKAEASRTCSRQYSAPRAREPPATRCSRQGCGSTTNRGPLEADGRCYVAVLLCLCNSKAREGLLQGPRSALTGGWATPHSIETLGSELMSQRWKLLGDVSASAGLNGPMKW